ncbi:MAG TPA: response regulator [Ktedonobacterales bacterium]|nr:response regulator [Ktedonobacterales bacterium]
MKKILIADDDSAIAELLTQALAEEGYETYKAVQSLRFLDAVRDHKPDLILLDLMMPYLEGRDELTLMKMDPTIADTPVIVITAYSDARQEEEEYRKLGVSAILLKPFDLERLLQLIRETIGR